MRTNLRCAQTLDATLDAHKHAHATLDAHKHNLTCAQTRTRANQDHWYRTSRHPSSASCQSGRYSFWTSSMPSSPISRSFTLDTLLFHVLCLSFSYVSLSLMSLFLVCLSFTLDTLLSHVLCLSFSYVVCLSFTLFLLCLMSLFLSCLTSKRDILTCLRETFCISAKVTECARATRPSHMARSTNMSFHVYTPSSGVRHEIALHEAPMR